MLNRFSPHAALGFDHPAERTFDLRDALNFVWRQWRFVAAILAASVLVGIVILLRATPIYTATAQVLLDPRKPKIMGEEQFYTEVALSPFAVETESAVIRSTALLRRVVEREKLVPSEDLASLRKEAQPKKEQPAPGTSILGELSSVLSGERKTAESEMLSYPPKVVRAIEGLRAATTVTRLPQSYIVTISFAAPDPARAARMANAIADAFIIDKLDARYEAAQRASEWLSDRLAELRNQVRDSEAAVAKFREEHGLLSGNSSITLNEQQLADLNGKLVAARTELAEKKARLDLLTSVQSKGGNLQTLLPDLVKDSQAVTALRSQLASITQREADLLARYGDRHPLVINVRAERQDVERHIANEVQKLAANVKNDYEIAKARADSLEAALKQVTGKGNLDSGAVATLRELERTAAINKTLFEQFLQRSKITQEQSTFEVREARIITPALPPSRPSSPNKLRTMLAAVGIGLLLGLTAAFGKEMLNSGFTTPKQIEEMLGLPLLSSVSRLDPAELSIDGKTISLPQYVVSKPLSRYSESMRALRSGIQMTDVDNPPKVVQVTSALPSEGKTTIAMSLAASTATSGLKVLFIDADLRRPSATKILSGKAEEGLVDILMGTATLQSAIHYSEDTKFWVIGAGSKTQNPPDLLSSERMKSLIANLRSSFDFVVIDTPPAGPVIDPIIVTNIVDKVVFVVRWASTARELIERTLQQVSTRKNVAGVVFNQVVDREAQKYGKHAYTYYYGARHFKNYYQG